ncbi:uncharacterized protein LOC130691514 [Daphnia carinata]|uniref:uncharacterized protein LOC130691514 n=1 Tax=Daphnia carinata TaxID=120202 RepID=UPI00257A6972|nr:uncharacterized protein LOC130691514 [Daphnia carinata]
MKFTIILACLLVLIVATEVKSESQKGVQLSPDQDVAEFHRGGFYGGYRGYWRGRRSAERKPQNGVKDDADVDREVKDEVEVDQEAKDEFEIDRETKDEVGADQEAKDEVGIDQDAKDEVGIDQEANDEVEVDEEVNEYHRGRRSAEELKNLRVDAEIAADQEANEFRRAYYGGYHGHWRGRRSAEEMNAAMNVPVYSDQDASEWYARRYYERPYTYRGY